MRDRVLSRLVQSAAAELRGRGSRYEAVVAIQPRGGDRAGARLLARVERTLAPARTLGRDLRVVEATPVRPLIKAALDLDDRYDAAAVLRSAHRELEPGTTADGRPGFFSSESWVLGQPVHLSQLVAALHGVTGVVGVTVRLFRRPDARRIDGDVATTIELGPLEVISVSPKPAVEVGVLDDGALRLRATSRVTAPPTDPPSTARPGVIELVAGHAA